MKLTTILSLAVVVLTTTIRANPVALPQTFGISNPLGSIQAGPSGISYTPPRPTSAAQPWGISVVPAPPSPKPTGGGIGASNPLLGSASFGQDGFTYKPPSAGMPFSFGVSPATTAAPSLQPSSGAAKGWNNSKM